MAEEPTHRPAPDLANLYPESGTKATPALLSLIAEEIGATGPMAFPRFMELALYHPEWGYYARDTQKTGKQGDFITSVSVGRCLGIILARRLHRHWQESGAPAAFHVVEPGAHDGTLANDILDEAEQLPGGFYQSLHYHPVEASPLLRRRQEKTLAGHSGKFSCHSSMPGACLGPGAVVSNELIDAFPVELVKFAGGRWRRQVVALTPGGGLVFQDSELPPGGAREFFDALGGGYPEGYTTEYNTGIAGFARSAAGSIESGLFVTIDYGHLGHDYYHPSRSAGTLQTYRAHRKAEDPLESPGEIDITAHVDFSRLQSGAESAGFHSPWFGTQASYLTAHARDWLLGMERAPDAELLRQFQTLTHPSMLGTRFQVLEMRL